MGIDKLSNQTQVNQLKIKYGNKDYATLYLDNLEGVKCKDNSLFKYLEKQGVKIDTDGDGIVDRQEAKLLRQALIELAGENGVIESKDFKKDIEKDKDVRNAAFNSTSALQNSGSNIAYNSDGSYVRTNPRTKEEVSFDKDGNETGGSLQGRKFTTELKEDGSFVRKFENGEVRNYSDRGIETGGTTQHNEIYYTSINGDEVIRKYKNTNDTRIYDLSNKQVGGVKDGKSYSIEHYVNGEYRYLYNDKNALKEVFDVDGNWIGGARDNNSYMEYTINYDGNGGYAKTFDDKSVEQYDNKGNLIGGTTQKGVNYSIKYGDDGGYEKSFTNNIVELYDSNNRLISGQTRKGTNYTINYNSDGSYAKNYEEGSYDLYDAKGNVYGGQRDGHKYTVEYSDNGYSEVFDNGTIQDFNSAGDLVHIKSTDAEYNITYDDNGNATWNNVADKSVLVYDSDNRLIASRSKNESYTIEYDKDGNQHYKYSDGTVMVYDKNDTLLSQNGTEVLHDNIVSNGKFDEKFNQGDVGNCWLLSGLQSVLSRPGGKAYLENLIKYNPETGNTTVRLPGAGKTYTVTKAEIENFNYLSLGDNDVRVLEIAFDKYLKSKGHAVNEQGSALDGNSPETFYNAVFPGAESTVFAIDNNNKFNTNLFNNKNMAYSLYTNGKGVTAVGVDGNIYTLPGDHGISVLRADENYVYVNDPNNAFDPDNPESTIFKIKISDFNKQCGGVISKKLPV